MSSLIECAHRTCVHVAPERKEGKRLTDRYQYRSHCQCGWVGPTLATAGEAQASGRDHRRDRRWLDEENARARSMVLEDTYISWA